MAAVRRRHRPDGAARGGQAAARQCVSIWGLTELRGIDAASDAVVLGALTTYTEVLRDELLRTEFPLLCRAAGETGGVAKQNRGTLGGNIANASPAADSPPALLVYDAELELVSERGGGACPPRLPHRLQADGTRARRADRAIRLPRPDGLDARTIARSARAERRRSRRCASPARARIDGGRVADVRIALGSVAPTVVPRCGGGSRCSGRSWMLRGAHGRAAPLRSTPMLTPIDDVRSTERYRHHVAGQSAD